MGWICWIFSFIFNAQRKLGGKFKLLDRHCDYFSSFEKISAHITTQRKGKMILMSPFLLLSSLAFPLPEPSPVGSCHTSKGPGSCPGSALYGVGGRWLHHCVVGQQHSFLQWGPVGTTSSLTGTCFKPCPS